MARTKSGGRASARRQGLILAAVAVCAALLAAAPSGAGSGSWTRTRKVAPGIFYTKQKIASGPYRIFVLSVKLSRPSTLDVVLATDVLPGYERTSSMALRSGALAAINGDYALESGRPVFALARDGFLDQTPFLFGRNFSQTAAETDTFIGHPNVDVWSLDPATAAVHSVDRVNEGPPEFDEVALFTPVGSYEEKPPSNACSARLLPAETPHLRTPEPGVEALHIVDEVLCSGAPMRRQGGVVLSTPATGPRAAEVAALVPGQQLSLAWSLGWTDVLDTIGGNPIILRNGTIVDFTGDAPFLGPNPRTGVGTTPDGRVLLVAVDGRQPGYSVGMTLERFAQVFKDYGADWALNLDGGGSTTFVLEGDIKNRPSDGPERAVSSALVVLPGADPGELTPPDAQAAASPWSDVVSDPASTGGFASYHHGRTELPRALRAAAGAFERD